MFDDPIDRITWKDASSLKANFWNPNIVHDAELRLLERSVLKTGWIQPVLISRDDLIIDGFHRWMLSRESKLLRAKYGGKLPCATLDVGEAEAMLVTVRINRAKGTHVAVRMHDLVKRLVDEIGLDRKQIAEGIGATAAEVDLLYAHSVWEAKGLASYRYSKAWVPEKV